jgi:tRNA1(Val) A37 N6-methylase TrmN6
MSFAPMAAEPAAVETSDDAVLGGRLRLRQPLRGHRVGHDAILLAAAAKAPPDGLAVELGAGVGAAGLALASRVPGLAVTLVEIDPALCALAAYNAERNGFGGRVRVVTLDVTRIDAFAAAGLAVGAADCVLMNPPFNDPARQNASPDASRRLAHVAAADTLPRWTETASSLLKAGGTLTLIWRADGLAAVLDALGAAGFGSIEVMPVYPRPGAPAIRVLVRAAKGGTGPLATQAGLTLNDSQSKPTTAAVAVLREGATLEFYGVTDATRG